MPRRLHARNRVTVTYRQAWDQAEQAIRTAANSAEPRKRVSAEICLFAFETLRVEFRDHRDQTVRSRAKGWLSARQIADELTLPRETTARVLAVLQTARVAGTPLLVSRAGSLVLQTGWMSAKPQRGDRSWLATDRLTWRALRQAVRAHDQADGGGRVWHKALGTATVLRYRCALPESGMLVARDGRAYRKLTDRDVCRRFGLDAPVWRGRRELLERAGALGEVLAGMAFGFRGWDALEGLAGVVDVAGYTPPFAAPNRDDKAASTSDAGLTTEQGDQEQRQDLNQPKASADKPVAKKVTDESSTRADDEKPGTVDNTCGAREGMDNPEADESSVAYKSGGDTPPLAHKSEPGPYKDHAGAESGLLPTVASRKVQPRAAAEAPVDSPPLVSSSAGRAANRPTSWDDEHEQNPSQLRRRAITNVLNEVCGASELHGLRMQVRRSHAVRTLVGHLHDAGYTPAETRHFLFVETPLPWPTEVGENADRAIGVLVWRLRQLLTARPSTAAYRAARDAEREQILAGEAERRRLVAADDDRYHRNIERYQALPQAQRAAVCQAIQDAIGSAWTGELGLVADDDTVGRRRHGQALHQALLVVVGAEGAAAGTPIS